MRGYSFARPVMLILIAISTNLLVTNLLLLFGVAQQLASDIGFIAMLIAAFVTFNRIRKNQRRR